MIDRFYFFKGRVALYAILKSMGIEKGDEIILPGFTCVVVPNAIQYLGAKPVYVDIDSSTYNVDPSRIEERITPRTRAIIAQHTFGIPAAMDRIAEIAKLHDLYIIEDSCHAIGSKYKGREVGSFGDAVFFSSQWSKPITTGLGGWAVANDPELSEKMERVIEGFNYPYLAESSLLRLQYHVFSKVVTPSLFWLAQSAYRRLSNLGVTVGSSSQKELQCEMPEGYAKKMSPWQKNLLFKKFAKIGDAIRHRKMITAIYEEELTARGIERVKVPSEFEPVFLRYPVKVRDKAAALDKARRRHLEIGDWFVSPVHPNLNGWEKVGYTKGLCPNAETACEHVINLPTHQRIKTDCARRIVEFVAENV